VSFAGEMQKMAAILAIFGPLSAFYVEFQRFSFNNPIKKRLN
jgi:hypothetical protein